MKNNLEPTFNRWLRVNDLHSLLTLNLNGETTSQSPCLVVMGDDSCSEGRGFESWHCIQDVKFRIYLL